MSGGQFGGGSNGSSRRGKKSASLSSDKPKQPQRGLGVAQLEKIRLHSQMEEMKIQAYASMQSSMGPQPSHLAYSSSSQASTTPYGYLPNKMIGIGDVERANLRFGEVHNQPTWNPTLGFPGIQPYGSPSMATRLFLNDIEDPELKMRNNWLDMAGSSGQNSCSGDGQDLDLELKL